MTFTLLIFWWGSFAGQAQKLNFPSLSECEAAKTKIVKLHSTEIAGKISMLCLGTGEK